MKPLLLVFALFTLVRSPYAGVPHLLASYTFEGDGRDVTGNCPSIDLSNMTVTNNTLFVNPTSEGLAYAAIPELAYHSFTVGLDFRPLSDDRNILSGGPGFRWIGFQRWDGHLVIALNNQNTVLEFPDARIQTNRWHSLVCSVFVGPPSTRIITFLNGIRLQDSILQNYELDVVGTPSEAAEKVFSFRNHGNAEIFVGYADNLRVYSRALTPEEILSYSVPRVNVARTEDRLIIHWPSELTGYILEATEVIQSPGHWTNVDNFPVLVGDRQVVIEPVDWPGRFFRLRR